MKKNSTVCNDERDCCFRHKEGFKKGNCSVLSDTYEKSGDCPFCKKYRDMKGDRRFEE